MARASGCSKNASTSSTVGRLPPHQSFGHTGDPFRVKDAAAQIMEHHDWHDGTTARGKAPYPLPQNVEQLLTGACPQEHHLKRNLDSRLYALTMAAYDTQIARARNATELAVARQDKTRFVSAGGRMASAWLSIPPKADRFATSPVRFPGHLFSIALRVRMGLSVPAASRGGRCRCKQTKAGTQRTERVEWDRLGHHLSGKCGWGGWRIKRHDDLCRVFMRYFRAAGLAATDQCNETYPACLLLSGIYYT